MAWLKESLLAKLMVGMLVSAIIPFALFNYIAYQTTSDSVRSQVIELNQHSMEVSLDSLKRYMQDLNRIPLSFYYDATLLGYLRNGKIQPMQSLYISNQVDALYYNRPELAAVRFRYPSEGLTYSKYEEGRLNLSKLPKDLLGMDGMSKGKDRFTYAAAQALGKKLLVVHHTIVDYPRTRVLGKLSLFVELSEIERLIKTEPAAEQSEVLLYIQKDPQLLYDSGSSSAADGRGPDLNLLSSKTQGAVSGEFHGKKGVFIYLKDDRSTVPLTLVKFIPAAAINESADRTLHSSLVIQLFAIAFLIVAAFVMFTFLISPVKRLLRSVARVRIGDFEVEAGSRRKDELGVLESRFLAMIQSLDDMMNKEYRSRLELSTAQLKMLQAQINPHFLYNTLQSIGTMALRHGAEDIHERIGDLGAILRYSMDQKTETVPLQLEIQHTGYYLSLQAGRFKNKLSYTAACEEEALQVRVPKMILQPLVENSIIHGIEKSRGAGALEIHAEVREGALTIRVMDSGSGMDEDTLARLRKEYESNRLHYSEERGIGLINVLQRLRLYAGESFEWMITSVPYEQTVISLRLSLAEISKKEESP